MSIERQPGRGKSQEKVISSGEQFSLRLKQLERQVGLIIARVDFEITGPLLDLVGQVRELGQQIEHAAVSREEKQEEEKLPLLRINTNKRQAVFDGKALYFRKNHTSAFDLLVFLAQNPNRDIPAHEIGENLFPCRRKDHERVAAKIKRLGKIMGNENNSRIITHSGNTAQSSYRLNAKVEFVSEDIRSLEPAKDRKAEVPRKYKPYLDEGTARTAYTIFALNDDGSGLKFLSVADVFEAIYPPLNEYRSRRADLLYKYRERTLPLVFEKMRLAWSLNPANLSLNLGKFMTWLKSQPAYANAKLDDLCALARREISFDEFLERGFRKKTPVVQEDLTAYHDLEVGQELTPENSGHEGKFDTIEIENVFRPFRDPPAIISQQNVPEVIVVDFQTPVSTLNSEHSPPIPETPKIPTAVLSTPPIASASPTTKPVVSESKIKGNGAHAEKIPKPEEKVLKEMILTNDETYLLAKFLRDVEWAWGRGGIAFPKEMEQDIEEVLANTYNKYIKIDDNILASLHKKMQLLDEYRELFVEQNKGSGVAFLTWTMLRVNTSKWEDFITALIPAKAIFISPYAASRNDGTGRGGDVGSKPRGVISVRRR